MNQPKVPIPRLQRTSQENVSLKERRRVARACTACRTHKVKCTGERPKCKHCTITSQDCVYIMPRKDRLRIVSDRCEQMAAMLRSLKPLANSENEARILDLLDGLDEDLSEDRQATTIGADTDFSEFLGLTDPITGDPYQEPDTESLDFLSEDLHTNNRPLTTGFIGKTSEIQWLSAVATAQLKRSGGGSSTLSTRRGSHATASSFTYWLDDEDVEIDFYVDPYDNPVPEVAERLFSVYMTKAHPNFPILDRKIFGEQFREYIRAIRAGSPPRTSPKWQTILNLVFAIGAKYSHFVKASWRGNENDHVVYQARARRFSLEKDIGVEHPDLSRIQGLGLLAFYWLAVGQVSRAWTTVGVALRFACSLGLHVRNEVSSASTWERETLTRVWWSLYSLERTLGIVTGRPSITMDNCCSVPLPVSVSEDQGLEKEKMVTELLGQEGSPSSTPGSIEDIGLKPEEPGSGSYFRATITLSIIVQDISSTLYSVATMIRPLEELQLQVAHLKQRLDQWTSFLHPLLNFQNPEAQLDGRYIQERTCLGFQVCGAKMLLTRPYLSGRIQPSRDPVDAVSTRMGDICIQAAQAVTDLLPDDQNARMIYDHGPWWCIVHYTMQAIAVFLLGLTYPSSTSYQEEAIVQCVRRVIQHLQAMQDPVANRASEIALGSFNTVMRRGSA